MWFNSRLKAENEVLKQKPEESPDDLQINHQIRVEAHLVA